MQRSFNIRFWTDFTIEQRHLPVRFRSTHADRTANAHTHSQQCRKQSLCSSGETLIIFSGSGVGVVGAEPQHSSSRRGMKPPRDRSTSPPYDGESCRIEYCECSNANRECRYAPFAQISCDSLTLALPDSQFILTNIRFPLLPITRSFPRNLRPRCDRCVEEALQLHPLTRERRHKLRPILDRV